MSNGYIPASGSQDPLWKAGALRISGSGDIRIDGSDKMDNFKSHVGISALEAADISIDTRISTE